MESYKQLEKQFSDYVGTKYGVAVNTGTAALHLALASLAIGKGDEVIVPEFTMIACAWAVTYTGAKPVFVDCGDDLLIDVSKIEAKITDRTRAIMPVHIYGRVCNMTAIMALAKKYNLRVIEDCCEAHGAMWKNKRVGSFDIGCFSFYINKIIPAQEGGFISTNDRDLHNKAQDMKSMSFGINHNYLHSEIGFNYRMTDSQANMVLYSLSHVNSFQSKRLEIQSWYDKHLNPAYKRPARQVVWVYDIEHPNMDALVKYLNENGIAARHGFKPMSMQPMYLKKGYEKLKAYKMSRKVCYLPVNPLMTEEIVKKICAKIDSFSA